MFLRRSADDEQTVMQKNIQMPQGEFPCDSKTITVSYIWFPNCPWQQTTNCRINIIINTFVRLSYTGEEMSSFWRKFRLSLSQKLPKWQLRAAYNKNVNKMAAFPIQHMITTLI